MKVTFLIWVTFFVLDDWKSFFESEEKKKFSLVYPVGVIEDGRVIIADLRSFTTRAIGFTVRLIGLLCKVAKFWICFVLLGDKDYSIAIVLK